ncbi:hypothetical protein RB653_003635 [Dictyostelium firmibasis]|uniref:Saposin B-type domain-containing protein n=1 Tax=Dictyostelium firmibasis TaxID=79012 RepID=A0AAN7U4W4_9MYCE
MNKTNIYFLIFTIILASLFASSKSLSINKNVVDVDNNQCQICELLVKDIIEGITANTSVEVIEHELNLICDHIPLHIRVCKQFVISNFEKIIQFIENNDNPQEICEKCGVCSSSENNNVQNRYFPQHKQHQRHFQRQNNINK